MDTQSFINKARATFQSLVKDLILWDERRCLSCDIPYIPTLPKHNKLDSYRANSTSSLTPTSPLIVETYASASLCPVCLKDLQQKPCIYCSLCGHALSFLSEDPILCGECLRTPPPWASLILVGQHTGFLRELLVRAKFCGNMPLLALLGTLLGARIASTPPLDMIVPLPLHPTRLRERGFNQCVEIGRACAAVVDVPLCLDAMERIRATNHQIGLHDEARRRNVQGAFMAHKERVHGQHVLLIDDAMTTGASLLQAATALHQAGVASLRIGIITRAQRN